MTEQEAFLKAIDIANFSPCAKSQRGVVIWSRKNNHIISSGFNSPPDGCVCDGSELCKGSCNKLAIHAEQKAIMEAQKFGKPIVSEAEMIHVKVVNGLPVVSRGPSCVDCSKLIVNAGISAMWLYEEGERFVRYSANNFHYKTLENLGLPVIKGGD